MGVLFAMSVMGSYAKDYEGAVKTTMDMNGAIVEYIGGIEVIKAFNQGKASYAKLSERIRANAQYYYHWMKKSQFGMSMAYSIVPGTLIAVLPAGWLFYQNGSLSVENFITTVILSLGIAGPLIAAMNFVDTLAQVGTTVEAVDELLGAEEQHHGNQTAVSYTHLDVYKRQYLYRSEFDERHSTAESVVTFICAEKVPDGTGRNSGRAEVKGILQLKSFLGCYKKKD